MGSGDNFTASNQETEQQLCESPLTKGLKFLIHRKDWKTSTPRVTTTLANAGKKNLPHKVTAQHIINWRKFILFFYLNCSSLSTLHMDTSTGSFWDRFRFLHSFFKPQLLLERQFYKNKPCDFSHTRITHNLRKPEHKDLQIFSKTAQHLQYFIMLQDRC